MIGEHYYKPNGYKYENNTKENSTIIYSIEMNPYAPKLEQKIAIAHIIGEELLKRDCIEFIEQHNFEKNCIILSGHVTAAPLGTKFSKVKDQIYTLEGEKFTEREIEKALQETYPERFI